MNFELQAYIRGRDELFTVSIGKLLKNTFSLKQTRLPPLKQWVVQFKNEKFYLLNYVFINVYTLQ